MSTGTKLRRELPRNALGQLVLDSYARMSDGFDGKEINIADQFQTNDGLIASRGHALGVRFSDPLSAWKRDVVRPEWNELVRRMRDGESAGAVIYNIDRFLRQNRQLEELLDTVEGLGCLLLSPGSEYDLDNTEHQMALRMQVTFANKSSADTKRRVRAKFAAMRERGILPGGGPRAFAWAGLEPAVPGQTKRRMVTEERLAAECEALVQAFHDVLDGKSLAAIAEEWNEAGLLGFYGNAWNTVTVRTAMSRGRHAGRIEHEGEVVGLIADHESTVDPAVFDQVQAKFMGRRRGAPLSKKYLATGIVCCGICLETLQARPRYPGGDSTRKAEAIPTYRCIKRTGSLRCGGVQIDQSYVDAFVRSVVIDQLSDPAVAEATTSLSIEANVRGIELQAELDSARETQESLMEKVIVGEIPQAMFDRHAHKLVARITALETQLGQLAAAAADLGAARTRTALSVAAEWDAADTEGKRKLLVAATRLVRIVVQPAEPIRGRRGPSVERCRMERR